MEKIKRYSNWCEVDQLDGVDLKNNEVLKLKFPDGKVRKTKIKVKKTKEFVSDHGHSEQIPVSEAFIEIAQFGAKALVSIVNWEAERVK